MWHCPPFNPVCLSSPILGVNVAHRSPAHVVSLTRRDTSSHRHSSFQPPIAWSMHFSGDTSCLFHRCTRYPVLSFWSRSRRLSFVNTLLSSRLEHSSARPRFFFCLAFPLRCICAMPIVSVFCSSRATSTTISSYLCLSPISCYLPAPYRYFALVLILLSIRCKLACDIHTILHPLVGVPQFLVSSREGRPLP